MKEIQFEKIKGSSIMFYLWSSLLAFLLFLGVYATCLMHAHGMFLSGLTNRMPWGIQVILADYYIGMAVGCMVVAALCDVFGRIGYKSYTRIAVYLALLFFIAALLSIMIDQGQMDRFLAKFISYFNPLSLFSIKPLFYSTLGLICCIFLYALITQKEKLTKIISLIGVLWAIVLHSGTGYIFGLVPRELYKSPLAPPIFIAAAIASGIAAFILVTVAVFKLTKRELDHRFFCRAGRILAVVVIVALCFAVIENIFRIYQTESRYAALFFLFGGFHSILFWLGWVLLGCIIPIVILFRRNARISNVVFASILVVFGVFCERWLMLLPGLMHPPDLFPGWEIVKESTVIPEGVVGYSISFPELAQAMGIFGLIGLLFLWGMKFLELIPKEAKTLQSAGIEVSIIKPEPDSPA